jgi:hypothetical protein
MRRLPIYFLIDTDQNIDEKTKVNYASILKAIIKKLRASVREFEKHKLIIDLNIITIGDECENIISEHSLDDVLNLKLIFEGQSNYLKGIKFLKNIIVKNAIKFYYTPIIISFLTKTIDEDTLESYGKLKFDVGKENSHPDYCEIFIDQYIDYNYIVLFKEYETKILNNFNSTILTIVDVDKYNFRGEIKDEEINLLKTH